MHPPGKMLIVRPIGEDIVPDLRILRLHVKSTLARNPVLQLLFEVSKEPPGQGNCLLTTLMARLGKHSFLLFFHIPIGGCQDPSICAATMGRFIVTKFKRQYSPPATSLHSNEYTNHPLERIRSMPAKKKIWKKA